MKPIRVCLTLKHHKQLVRVFKHPKRLLSRERRCDQQPVVDVGTPMLKASSRGAAPVFDLLSGLDPTNRYYRPLFESLDFLDRLAT